MTSSPALVSHPRMFFSLALTVAILLALVFLLPTLAAWGLHLADRARDLGRSSGEGH